MKQDVLNVFEKYIKDFLESDLNLINSFIEYPLTFISDGDVTKFNKFPVNPKEWAESRPLYDPLQDKGLTDS